MPTNRNDGLVTLKFGRDVFPPGSIVQSTQYVSGESLVLLSVSPAPTAPVITRQAQTRVSVNMTVSGEGVEIPIGNDVDEFVLSAYGSDLSAGKLSIDSSIATGKRLTLVGGTVTGKYVTIKSGESTYNTKMVDDVQLTAGSVLELELVELDNSRVWSQLYSVTY